MTLKEYYLKGGLFFGFPKCCSEWFSEYLKEDTLTKEVYKTGKKTKEQKHFAKLHTGFIPCPNCAKELHKSGNSLETLISNRICKSPFPKGDIKAFKKFAYN